MPPGREVMERGLRSPWSFFKSRGEWRAQSEGVRSGNAPPHNGHLTQDQQARSTRALPATEELSAVCCPRGPLGFPLCPHLLPLPHPQPWCFSGPDIFQRGSAPKASWQLSGVWEPKLISPWGPLLSAGVEELEEPWGLGAPWPVLSCTSLALAWPCLWQLRT